MSKQHPLNAFTTAGFNMKVNWETQSPEITTSVNWVFWQSLSTDEDMRISEQVFPLSEPVSLVMKKVQ